jgi:hypothetical protein
LLRIAPSAVGEQFTTAINYHIPIRHAGIASIGRRGIALCIGRYKKKGQKRQGAKKPTS